MNNQEVENQLGMGERVGDQIVDNDPLGVGEELVTTEQAAAVADTAGAKSPEPAPSPVMTTGSLGTPTPNNGDGSCSDPKDVA